jgi:hypothetical protein
MSFLYDGETPAWDIGYEAGDNLQRVVEFVRPGQTVDNWTELVTIQTYNKAVPWGSVEEQIAENARERAERCPGSTEDVIRQMPDGVLIEGKTVNCEQGADEHGVARVLDGTLSRFVVHYAVRGPVEMTPERRTEWIEKLSAIEIISVP